MVTAPKAGTFPETKKMTHSKKKRKSPEFSLGDTIEIDVPIIP